MRKIQHKGGARRCNRELAMAATDAIAFLTTIPQEKIRVRAHNGHLDLEGHVSSLCQRRLIEDVARSLPGVREISNVIWVEADPDFSDVRAVPQ